MYVDAKRMSQPMSEILSVAFLRDDIPRDTVNVRAVLPGSESILRRHLSLQYDPVDLSHLILGLADSYSTGHISAVALILCAEIQGDHVSRFNSALSGDSVGQ